VREAITSLEQQGLVTSIPNQGAYVVQLTPEQLQNALMVRAHLESLAMRLILADRNPALDKFDLLAEIVDKMQAVAADAARHSSVEHNAQAHGRMNLLDADFHQELIGCSGNDALQRTWTCVAPVDLIFVYDIAVILDGAAGQVDLRSVAEQHVRLLAYLRSGDRQRAEREIKAHFMAPNRAHSTYLDDASLAVLGWLA
jgi:DNA-binding GntR family transcriptional regulator